MPPTNNAAVTTATTPVSRAADPHPPGPAAEVGDGDGLRERDPPEARQLLLETRLDLIHRAVPLQGRQVRQAAVRRNV